MAETIQSAQPQDAGMQSPDLASNLTQIKSSLVPTPTNGSATKAVFHAMTADELASLSDHALQSHILHLGQRLVFAQRRYESSSCFADKGERDRIWIAERAALHERASRPHLVAAMEQARGVA